ncbi:type I polyketide synthase [Janthinobacterium fluminis]|uniref:SDR family NAD(P)-dependent oxidoreductase n=1 Tax=Janthinobacterium fluminis TaxID=2987524 RepID=A0ABT5K7F4_9BURK|nr:type I polyketide synthase [Janthinobacterium fluminis]MDC8759687.1 SDR family NAD(P)-dependent oxidoreductase [Janthinobacterium fluminis]
MNHPTQHDETSGVEIAIVGLTGRFPGAADVDAFWRNIRDGVESVSVFSDEELRGRGVGAGMLADPGYVKAGVVLDGMEQFDAGFFGYSPRDAEQLDPQQRVFLETAWHALEHAGYAGAAAPGLTGVYAGSGSNLYLMRNLLPGVDWHGSDIASLLGLMNGNDQGSLATRVAYKLDLRGPAVSVQTACSTSLVAVHLACRSLLNYETDLALAGGVWLNLLQDAGYRYQPGAILSPDGHCRAFDAAAAGTVIGSGAGVVVLKRLAEALHDGDTIHAVIKGSALNNDGALKMAYSAPSVDGQADVIQAAQAMAGVPADSIGYVEAHGTGTTLGDPVEIAALTQAFRAGTQRRGYCAIGSVKTNIGHLDAAAGVAGLIKTVLALQHRTLPPSLNFEQANAQIDFAASPFYVNTQARPWPAGATRRRAGVSSFGMGGTNAHVLLEEAPPAAADEGGAAGAMHMLMLSARSAAALDCAVGQLAGHLERHPEQALADVAHTLYAGRKRFAHRAVALGRDHADAVLALSQPAAQFFSGQALAGQPTVAFLFPGQGAQHVDMGRALYQGEAVVREAVDRCSELLASRLGLDLRALLYPAAGDEAAAAAHLEQTAITQPALFVLEYAMAQLWISRGVQPDAMLGHSIGEYVAACLAGVFSLEDALAIVAERGRLLQATQAGAMLAVRLPEADLRAYLDDGCDLAAVNAADSCVLSGPGAAIDAAERELAGRGVGVRRLHVSHAFHSALMEPVLGEFEALLRRVEMRAPRIPFISNLSGQWITAQEACSPAYWVRHVRGTVRFADGLNTLLESAGRILLEVGPGDTLSGLARRHPLAAARPVLATQCHPARRAQNADQPARCLAQLWVAGVELDAAALGVTGRRRVALPGYPFERQAYWIAPAAAAAPAKRDMPDWFYAPVWKRGAPLAPAGADDGQRGLALVLSDAHGLGEQLLAQLRLRGRQVVLLERGAGFERLDPHRYAVRPGERDDLERALRAVQDDAGPVSDVYHLWSLDAAGLPQQAADVLERGFHSLLCLAQALDAACGAGVSITVLANQLEDVTGQEALCPEKATLYGPCKVIPQEYPNLACRLIDVVLPADAAGALLLARQIVAETAAARTEAVVAYRGAHRWSKTFEPARRDTPPAQRLRRHGVYLITGGLGGVGLALARHLAQAWQAKLVLLGRSALPPRQEWSERVALAEPSDPLRRTLLALLELEALGAQVLTVQADVADPVQMAAAVAAARQRFGALNGLVHAAGAAGGGMIGLKSRAAVERVFAPKLQGSLVALAALKDEALDFVLLCSSLTAVAGGFGQADYCSANCFLDALASRAAGQDGPWVVSVNWDAWRELGMAAGQNLPDGEGIRAGDGGALLEHVLSGPAVAQLLVSTIGLERQIARTQAGEMAERLLPAPVARRQQHARPALQDAYVAPANEFEQGLAELWSEFLGIAPIGVNDHLFELGGDSLLAIQLLAKVRSAYGVELHPAGFFKNPTIAALAALVEARLIEEIERAELAVSASV